MSNFIAVVLKARCVNIEVDGTAYTIEELTDATFGDSPADINKGTTLRGAGYAAAGFSTPPEITLEAIVNPGLDWVTAIQGAKDAGKLVTLDAFTPAKTIFTSTTALITVATIGALTGTISGTGLPSTLQLARGAGVVVEESGTDTLVGVVESVDAAGTTVTWSKAQAAKAVSTAKAFDLVVPSYEIPKLVCEIVDWNINLKEGDGAAAIQMGSLQLQPLTSIPQATPGVRTT